jgi:predicted ATPase
MWGPVGRGKTTIMELFARTMPKDVVVKRHSIEKLLAHIGQLEAKGQAGPAAGGAGGAAARKSARAAYK